jgi:HD-GYP domain-containing protein (c-di-GMP phosphodiesterase class II)
VLGFCADLADPRAPATASRPHVRVGEAAARPPGFGEELEQLRVKDLAGPGAAEVAAEVRRVREVTLGFAEHREVRFTDCDEIVYHLLARLARAETVFQHLAEVREHNLFSYLHTTNVTTLVVGFALRLGIRERGAYELGISALLHDVGKTLIPEAVLNKPGKLTPEEWEIVKRHPAAGARAIIKETSVPRTAVAVAFEHHLQYDGHGGYPELERPRRPCLQAQLVAITDSFDALFARRSYHRDYDILEALELLQDGAGTMYDPWLVDAFTRFLLVDLEKRGPLDFWSSRQSQWS